MPVSIYVEGASKSDLHVTYLISNDFRIMIEYQLRNNNIAVSVLEWWWPLRIHSINIGIMNIIIDKIFS